MELKDLLEGKDVFLFDFDGVVTDSEVYAFSTLRALVKDNFGILIDDSDIEFTIGLDTYGTAEAVSRKYSIDLSGERLLSLLQSYPVYYTEYEGITAFPYLEEFFRCLKDKGYIIGIVSSTIRPHLDAALSRLHLSSYPEIVIGGDMVKQHKPDPEPYIMALRMLGKDAAEAVVIEDSPVGILSAKRAGLDVIAFCGSAVKQDIEAADIPVNGYDELIQVLGR